MSENETKTCAICGTPFVPAKKELILGEELVLDGTWGFGNEVCPKCHPDLVKDE